MIANRASGLDEDRLIVMQHSYLDSNWQPGICQNIDCTYRPDNKFNIGQWTGQWVSVEMEGMIDAGIMRLYLTTQDGIYNDTIYLDVENPMRSSHWNLVQIIGGYFNGGATAGPDNYYLIDELAIDSQHIGPPAGFVGVGPDMSFSSDLTSVESGGSVTLTWNSSNANSCLASGNWSGDKSVSGSEVINNITSNQVYTLVCSNAGGEASRSVSVSVQDLPVSNSGGNDNNANTSMGNNSESHGNGALHPLMLLLWCLLLLPRMFRIYAQMKIPDDLFS